MRDNHRRALLLCTAVVLLLLPALLGGCLPGSRPAGPFAFDLDREGLPHARINCFLTLENPEGPAVRLEVSSLEILAGDTWLPLSRGALKLDSSAIGPGQRFLGSEPVPAGFYDRLRLTVARGEVRNERGGYDISGSEPLLLEISLDRGIEVEAGDSASLLFAWNLEKSLQPGQRLQPAISVLPSRRPIMEDLIFVSCPEIDTIFVVRTDRNWVVDSFGVEGAPTWLSIDPDASRERLYVLTARDRTIKVVNLSSYRVVDFFPAPLHDVPTFMTCRWNPDEAFLLDADNGYVTRMDLETGQILARSQLGFRPSYAAYFQQRGLLAVSLSLSQKIVFLHPENLDVVKSITSGGSPQGLALVGNLLYITEYADSTVSIAALARGETQSRFAVGFGPIRIQEADSQLYISNYFDGSLSVVVPEQLGVIQGVYGLDGPVEMEFNPFYRRLYVTETTGSLAVIDVTSNMLQERIVLGARPFGLAGIQ